MDIGSRRSASRELTHVGLVLAPRRTAGRRFMQALLPTGALIVGAGIGFLGNDAVQQPVARAAAPGPSVETVRLRQQLDEARSALRLAGARGQELEQQIDALNHRLREATVELTFVKKAREGARH